LGYTRVADYLDSFQCLGVGLALATSLPSWSVTVIVLPVLSANA
jgi:hypothetical protein